jgi:hypothetical protein
MLNYFLSTRQESDAEKASRAFEDKLNGLRKTLEAYLSGRIGRESPISSR